MTDFLKIPRTPERNDSKEFIEMTESQSLALDAAAHTLAVVALCTAGPPDCPGRVKPASEPDTLPPEGVMRRAAGVYRMTPPGTGRRYLCRFCRTEHIFPPQPTADAEAAVT